MTTQTPVIQLTPIGTNYPALSIPGPDQIRGVQIDNPSGAWLLLRTTGDYIPPYTIGFARSFDVGRVSIAIEYTALGPGGQVSTLAGDPARVILSSDPVGNASGNSSGGTAYVEQFTPVSLAQFFGAANTLGTVSLLIAAVASKRLRLLTYSIFAGFTGTSLGIPPVGVVFGFTSTVTFVGFSGRINPPAMASGVQIINLDLPIGEGLNISVQSDWAQVDVEFDITFQRI
jgi:hypothetical protein